MGTAYIVSDLHLGSGFTRYDIFTREIIASNPHQLILNGDILHSLNFHHFTEQDWRVIFQLRAFGNDGRLVLVRGNHDEDKDHPAQSIRILEGLLGVKAVHQATLMLNEGLFEICHGDQFDRTLNMTWIGEVVDWFYQRLQNNTPRFAHWLKHMVKALTCHHTVKTAAMFYASNSTRKYAGIVLGHTHYAADEQISGLRYLNSGCWVETPCSAVKVTDGTAQVVYFPA